MIVRTIAEDYGFRGEHGDYIGVALAAITFTLVPKRSRDTSAALKRKAMARHNARDAKYDPVED